MLLYSQARPSKLPPVTPSLPEGILNNKVFWLDNVWVKFRECSSSNEDGGWGVLWSGEARLREEGQTEIFGFKDWGSFTFSYIKIVFIPHFLLQITLVRRDNAADTQGLFPHRTTNTAPLSGEPKRNFWASTSPPFVWRIKKTQFHFQQKLKRKIMKRTSLLFFFSLLIYCCIQGRGSSERHWYWVPWDPIRVTPQLSNEHVFLHLHSKLVMGLEVTFGSAPLCETMKCLSVSRFRLCSHLGFHREDSFQF